MASEPIPGGGLNVIALVSGGKDSFFSALHCLENGHRLVALANLHPPGTPGHAPPGQASVSGGEGTVGSVADTDLNSFMYQTVGHQVIPLYAEATRIPLYRRAISGGALQSARDYSSAALQGVQPAHADTDGDGDETESMIPLLQSVMRKHPEANALSAGAILSTYQRTRVESVALRLGLTPLAYLWKYPVLPPPPGASRDEAQLLFDMAAAGLDARVIKVASGGLDESFLWERVASARGVTRLKKAMGRFGSAGLDTGAVIGEGGEFETLVVDGPRRLFKKRVVVPENARLTVREGGGTAWLSFGTAMLEDKDESKEGDGQGPIRRPDLWDARFAAVLETIKHASQQEGIDERPNTTAGSPAGSTGVRSSSLSLTLHRSSNIETWAFTAGSRQGSTHAPNMTIREETTMLVRDIQEGLSRRGLPPSAVLSTVIVLRSMADFPAVNAVYGALFPDPNPPSRVTISCGDLLPPSSGNIAIYLTMSLSLSSSSSQPGSYGNNRDGLHVQSRSYWAPANIGPYSQAITFPVSSSPFSSSPQQNTISASSRIVHIAGQIPLVPASMEFLPSGTAEEGGQGGGSLERHLVLSLQHLWRIGAEVGVQWWTSAAVYFPRPPPPPPPAGRNVVPVPVPVSARERALLAWRVWKEAHVWNYHNNKKEGDDDEDGPDLWDRKFNPKYMSYADDAAGGGASKGSTTPDLPDYSLLSSFSSYDNEEENYNKKGGQSPSPPPSPPPPVPYFFAVEVDALPRSAAAEWHAHAGLSGMTTVGSGADHRASSSEVTVSTWRGRGRDGEDDDDDDNSATAAAATGGGGGGGTETKQEDRDMSRCEVNHCLVISTISSDDDDDEDEGDEGDKKKDGKVACLHSVVALEKHSPPPSQGPSTSTSICTSTSTSTPTTPPKTTLKEALSQATKAFHASLETPTPKTKITLLPEDIPPTPYLVYVDTEAFSGEEIAAAMSSPSPSPSPSSSSSVVAQQQQQQHKAGGEGENQGGTGGGAGLPVIPCKNIYGCGGGREGSGVVKEEEEEETVVRLSVVVLYRHFLS